MQVPPFSLSQQISDLGTDLETAVLDVLRSGQYIGGPQIQQFQEAFAASVGTRHAIGCNSGTDALILALRALGIGGDEVVTCSFSFATGKRSVRSAPHGVRGCGPSHLPDRSRSDRSGDHPGRKALIPVHLFGRPVDMTRLMAIATSHGLKVVEDCAQPPGTLERPGGGQLRRCRLPASSPRTRCGRRWRSHHHQ